MNWYVTFLALLVAILHQAHSMKQYKFIAMAQRRMPKCEKVKSETCLTKVSQGYNSTMFPNHFNHTNQDDAIGALKDFIPLIEYGCSKYLATFLCSVYIPICTPGLTRPIKPCRSLCLKASNGCAEVMLKHGYKWNFNCQDFPDAQSGNGLCLGVKAGSENEITEGGKKKKNKKKKGTATTPGPPVLGRRVTGRENDELTIKCPQKKTIWIRKVVHSHKSTCCRTASTAVLSAMCHGKSECRFNVSPSSLGGHCQQGNVGKISVRYRCSSQTSKRC